MRILLESGTEANDSQRLERLGARRVIEIRTTRRGMVNARGNKTDKGGNEASQYIAIASDRTVLAFGLR
jgi:hypothetical protein